jgi:antitoxin (DNA-binding transcriptional repressor) of toxin-antitoxin stability system
MGKSCIRLVIALAPLVVWGQQSTSLSQADAQTRVAPGTLIQLEMSRDVDVKKAHPGDSFQTRLWDDVHAGEKIILAKRTVIVAHVVEAQPRTKINTESRLTIAFDKAILKDRSELPLHGVVVRVQLSPIALAAASKSHTQLYSPNPGSSTNVAMPAQLPEPGTGGPENQLSASGPTNIRDSNIGVEADPSGTLSILISSKENVKLKHFATLDVRITR